MGLFEIASVLIVLTALFSYVNYRTVGLPTTVGVMVISMLVSLGIAGMGAFGLGAAQRLSPGKLVRPDLSGWGIPPGGGE